MKDLLAAAQRVAPTEAPVLILGERGVGKRWLARALHRGSGRRGEFASVTSAAAPEAFDRWLCAGDAPVLALGGSLLLEDVDQLGEDLQCKLVRLLDGYDFRRHARSKTSFSEIRLMSTARSDLASRVQEGEFRADLYFRLAVFSLRVPPLRQRREDLLPLAQRICQGSPIRVSAAAQVALESYPWPGNLHELGSVFSAAGQARGTDEIDIQHLPARIAGYAPTAYATSTRLSFKDAKDQLVSQFERAYIGAALQECGGNLSLAASASGLHRKSIARLARKYQVRVRGR